MAIVGPVIIVNEYKKYVCRVTRCLVSDSGVKIKIKISISQTSEISRNAFDQ
jgi:hypothetical protein